jgi:hypothetical protein
MLKSSLFLVVMLGAASPAYAACMANGYGCNEQQQRIIGNMQQQQQQFNGMRNTVDNTFYKLQNNMDLDGDETQSILDRLAAGVHDQSTRYWCQRNADASDSECY